jgi:hypothetical protein
MNVFISNEGWCDFKDRIRQEYVFLTDSDLCFEKGEEEAMIHRLRITLGKSKLEMNIILAELKRA